MADHDPLVSIGMPVRNNESTLGLALRSILNQSYRHWELLLLDDGSTDGTLRTAQSFADADSRIRVCSGGSTLGLPNRLNQAIATSRGQYFARMDGDDISYPERLECQVHYLQDHPDVALVGTAAIVFGRNGTLIGKRTQPEKHEAICCRPHVSFSMMHPTFLGRLGFFQSFQYRPCAIRCEDQDLLLRAYMSGHYNTEGEVRNVKFGNLQRILFGYNEERLNVVKLLKSRFYHSLMFSGVLAKSGRPLCAIQAAALQVLKVPIDIISIVTGLNHRLLRHRARPVTSAELETWRVVWSSIQ